MATRVVPVLNENQDPNFLNASRGSTSAAEGVGDFIGALGTTVQTLVNGLDAARTQQVDDEVRSSVERADLNYYGVNANPDIGDEGQSLPREAQSQVRRLEQARRKFESGRISETHYWTILNSTSKNIRSKYPGYVNQIDAAFARLAGSTPANALRRIQNAEVQAAAEQANATSRDYNKRMVDRVNYLQGVIKQGGMPGAFRKYAGNLEQFARNEELYSNFMLAYNQQQSESFQIDTNTKKNEYLRSIGQHNEREAARVINQKFLHFGKRGIFNESLIEDIQAVNRLRAEGRAPTPETMGRIAEVWSNQRAQLMLQRERILSEAVQYGQQAFDIVNGTSVKIIDDAIRNMDNIVAGDMNASSLAALKSTAFVISNQKEFDEAEMRRSVSGLNSMEALKNVLGETTFQVFMTRNANILDPILDQSLNQFNDAVVNSDPGALIERIELAQRTGQYSPELAEELIERSRIFVSGEVKNKDVYRKVFNMVFGPRNNTFIARLPQERREQIFNNLVSPEVAKRIKQQYETGTLSERDLEKYDRTVIDWFTSMYQTDINELNAVNRRSSTVKVFFNPETLKFDLHSGNFSEAGRSSVFAGLVNLTAALTGEESAAARPVIRMNRTLQRILSTRTSLGVSEAEARDLILRAMVGRGDDGFSDGAMRFNPAVIREGNVIERLGDWINSFRAPGRQVSPEPQE